MATTDQIAQMRRSTALEEDDPTYTDSLIGGMIDDLGFPAAAAQIWREKAAAVAGLVDTTESGSSRSLSQLRKAFTEMAGAVNPTVEEPVTSASFTIPIERV